MRPNALYIESGSGIGSRDGHVAAKTANGSASVGVMGVPMVDKGAGMTAEVPAEEAVADKMTIWQSLHYRQTWAFAVGKFLTDGVWWFFLFWTPAYLKAQYDMTGTQVAWPIAVLYTITVAGSVFGGKFPTYFINRGMNPYAAACGDADYCVFPAGVLLAQPLGYTATGFPFC